MPIILPIIAAAGALYTIGSGIAQKAKANRIRRQNVRPQFQIQPEYTKNVSLAQNMAQEGLPQSAEQFYQTQAERALQSANDTALQTGQGVNAIAGNLDVYNQGVGRIAAQSGLLKNENIRYLIDQQTKMAEERQKEFAINQYAPFQERAREAAAMTNAGSQNINTGIQQGIAAAASFANSQTNSDLSTVRPNATVVTNNATTGAMGSNPTNISGYEQTIANDPVLTSRYYELIQNGTPHAQAVNILMSGIQ